jgi:hypothetical protein
MARSGLKAVLVASHRRRLFMSIYNPPTRAGAHTFEASKESKQIQPLSAGHSRLTICGYGTDAATAYDNTALGGIPGAFMFSLGL